MRWKVRRPARIDLDLCDLVDYLARSSPKNALRFLDSFDKTLEWLVASPERGAFWDTPKLARSGIRVWPVRHFKKILIFYRIEGVKILLMRILHGARDLETELGTR